ncbi:RHS repeat domain-containing protein [Tenacibaculum aiptasiae]|uniref:RHS repeat domain-containing protein n=1 Tax=Tenacibaculum aiptasiae TaxID=426481 RepID=UPI003B5AA26E
MKKIKLLTTFLLLLFINSINIFSQQELEKGIPIKGGDNNCRVSILYNSQPLPLGAIPLSKTSHSLSFNVTTQYCYKALKVMSTESWVGLPSITFFDGGILNISIPANNTPIARNARITIVEDNGDGLYGLLLGGSIYIEQQGDPNLNSYYIDTDDDTYGDYTSKVVYALTTPSPIIIGGKSVKFVANNLDKCPLEPSSINNGCEDSPDDQDRNWLRTKTYDIRKKLVGASKTYYDNLGKLEQAQSYDIKNKRTWSNQTFYDAQGRPALQTLNAPITPEGSIVTFGYKNDLVKNSSGTALTTTDIESEDVINSVKISPNGNPLGEYYANREGLQENTTRPYSKTIYSELNPGSVKQVIGGNKHDTNGNGTIDENDDKWKRGYSFSMPAGQEMYYVYGYDAFPSNPSEASIYTNITGILNNTNNHIVWLKAGKTVVQDVHGNESVVFTDADGKTLGAARSGGTKKYEILSLIGEQKFVDIHIPVGCDDPISFLGPDPHRFYKIYNLKTEENIPFKTNLSPGFYRIEYIGNKELTKSHGLTYIDKTTKAIQPVLSDAVGVRYKVNYYDYSLNYYNTVGQLTASLQPLGFNADCLTGLKEKASIDHNNNLKSTFEYTSLGQLKRATSPDEGEAWFKYRNDGQIRFSQNSKQKLVNEYSYTNYDELGRPIESGVSVDGFFAGADPENPIVLGNSRREQNYTQYDFINDVQKAWLENNAGADYKNPTFLSGNVARTFNDVSETYYSYDVHGRVKWIVQKNIGLDDAKTIDYEYDPVTSQVLRVDFEKDNPTERFVHKYTYDPDTQSLVMVETSKDNNTFTIHATYVYYKDGSLKKVILAEGIQDIDYVYNLNGQLKGINHPSLAEDPTLNPKGNDLFGLKLDYHVGDYTKDIRFKTSHMPEFEDQYNGNIKSMKWNVRSEKDDTSSPLQYNYKYNRNNWLKEAVFDGFGSQQSSALPYLVLDYKVTSTQHKTAMDSIIFKPGFEVKASASLVFSAKTVSSSSTGTYGLNDYNVSNITYDANGNLLSLDRNKSTEKIGGIDKNEMDKLRYEYKKDVNEKLLGNQLLRVDDLVTGITNSNDIKDQDGDNYEYNIIGELTENKSENVKYEYNANSLVTKVLYENKIRVAFKYNDKGYRTQKLSYDSSGTTVVKETNYVLDASGSTIAIYENKQQKELPIYGASRLGVHNKASGANVYQLTDHLGNVRAVIVKDGDKAIAISKTDYYPFGMPMPNRDVGSNQYRYKYQGQEKDEETGKEAFQLRLWDARIGRWLITDPKGEFSSPYLGMANNPINKIDPDGGSTESPPTDIYELKTDHNGKQVLRFKRHIDDGKKDVYIHVIKKGSNEVQAIYHHENSLNGAMYKMFQDGIKLDQIDYSWKGGGRFAKFKTATIDFWTSDEFRTKNARETMVNYVTSVIPIEGAIFGMLGLGSKVGTGFKIIKRGATQAGGRRVVLQRGKYTLDITADRVKMYVKNHRNPRARYGDAVNFKKYGVPEGSSIIKGAGKGHKRTPTKLELDYLYGRLN